MNCFFVFFQLGTQGGITLGGVIGYQFEAEGYISGCRDWQTEAVVCTTIEDEWPRAYVNLSSWYQTDKSVPCGFEVSFLVLRKFYEFLEASLFISYLTL